MKATGVIRRIDDLGRVVIPKEIRKNLRIKNGDNLEIYINEEDNIILKRYNHIDKMIDLAKTICYTLSSNIKKNVLITNTNEFIAIEGSLKKKYLNKQLSEEILKFIIKRKEIITNDKKTIQLVSDQQEIANYAIVPMIANSECIGLIIVISETAITKEEFEIIKVTSNILTNYLES